MAFRVRPCRSLDELASALGAIGHYFGWVPSEDDVERFSKALPPERMHACFDGKEIVGGAGVFPFEMTVPGAIVPCAGVTVVGVLPTHRRRGILTRMMRAQIDDVHERGEPFAALWASEATIYGRYGYGLASLQYEIRLPRLRAALRAGTPQRAGDVRLVDGDEAAKTFPRVYERVRRETPGFLSRSKDWWELRRLRDDASRRPPGAGPLNYAQFELEGRPAGYALYRLAQTEEGGQWKRRVRVIEAVGVDAVATREIWRFLTEIDWTDEILAWLLPADHPIQLLVGRPDHLDLNGSTRALGEPRRYRQVAVRARLSRRRPRHARARGRVLPVELRHLDGRGRHRQALEPEAGRPPRLDGARRRVPRRLLVRAARAGGAGRGGRTRRARACGRALRVRPRPLVPRDLLS